MDTMDTNKDEQQTWLHVTHDHGWAWVISLACASINGITFGLFRSYGVLFQELLEKYQLSREAAAWPFSLCMTFTHLSGPIAGLLLSLLTMRSLVFIGSLIASIGIIMCYFATSITEFIVYIGVIQGFGIGLSFMQTPVILAQYFQKYRSTATAIAYAGGTIGSFIFPPIINYLLEEYDLRGCFLLIGGMMLNALPFALLLRPAIINTRKVRKIIKQVVESTAESNIKVSKKVNRKRSTNTSYIQSLWPSDNHSENSKISVSPDCSVYQSQTIALMNARELADYRLEILYQSLKIYNKKERMEKETSCQLPIESKIDKICQTEAPKTLLTNIITRVKIIVSIIHIPLYIVLCLTHVSFQWAWYTYQMVIVDFAVDRGMAQREAIILLSSFAVADLFGRLASGLIADKHLVRKKNIVSVCILLIGVLIFMTPSAVNFRILLTMTIALGFVSGSIIVLFSVLTMEYVGFERLPIALGTTSFIVGISTLMRPVIIGYFRDTRGTYDGLFHFVGLLAFLTALLWLSEPFLYLCAQKRKKTGYGFRVIIV